MIAFLFFQVVVGLVIGFYFTDKKRGISWEDIRFGAIVILISVSVLLFTSDVMSLHTIAVTGFSTLVLFASIFVGEYIHVKLINVVLDSIQKENIHASVRRLVEVATRTAADQGSSNKEFVDVELYKTVNCLKDLSKRAACLEQKELAQQIDRVAQSCITLSRLSAHITSPQDEAYHKYEELANQLVDLSWDTLSRTEQGIKHNLGKNWSTISFAMKVTHMK